MFVTPDQERKLEWKRNYEVREKVIYEGAIDIYITGISFVKN